MRSPVLLVATGAQDIGKSFNSLKQAIFGAYISPTPRKTLLFDSNGEYAAYEIDGKIHKIKILGHNEIIKFGNQLQSEVRRIAPFLPNGMPMEEDDVEKLVIRALKEMRGGVLLIEDTNTIFGDHLPDAVTKKICSIRHRNCDCILHLQSLSRVSKKIRQNAKIIRYHYQIDAVEDAKDNFAGEIEIYYIVEKLVNKQVDAGNKYFFVYIYRMVKKVKGAFSQRMFADAIKDYLYDHPVKTTQFERRRGTDGKKLYTYEEAIILKTHELFKKYYGNDLKL